VNLFDAHNHLQDERFGGRQRELLETAKSVGVAAMVVNGSSEEDWPDVGRLAESDPVVIPSFGLHPWYVPTRSPAWLDRLTALLTQNPHAAVGEIGLDRWKEELPYEDQEDVFLAQWHLARELNRPASIHCLKCWGRLLELLREHHGPARGFVLHSYGGPREMIRDFAALGAYFSFPGYYLHERKEKQCETFRHVPPDRLLIETDAPDQGLPDHLNEFPLHNSAGHAINHPANLRAVLRGLATALNTNERALADQLQKNFRLLFPEH
jgi:TatD DNase family protein